MTVTGISGQFSNLLQRNVPPVAADQHILAALEVPSETGASKAAAHDNDDSPSFALKVSVRTGALRIGPLTAFSYSVLEPDASVDKALVRKKSIPTAHSMVDTVSSAGRCFVCHLHHP